MPIAPLFNLSGKVALVAYANGPVAKSIAHQLAAHGAKVVVSAGDNLDRPSDRGECRGLIDEAIAASGRLDILVCGMMDVVAEATAISQSIAAPIWLAERACKHMAERKDGAVIVLGSADGLRGTQTPGLGSLTRAAGPQLARDLAVRWGPHNIRANCVAVADVSADAVEAAGNAAGQRQAIEWTYPMQRLGTADDVAGVVVALAGPAGAWMSGQTIVIDGGMMAGSGREEG